jgi:hypothetical protein
MKKLKVEATKRGSLLTTFCNKLIFFLAIKLGVKSSSTKRKLKVYWGKQGIGHLNHVES